MGLKTVEITASTKLKDKEGNLLSEPSATCEMESGDTYKDLEAIYGDKVVLEWALAGQRVWFQGKIRERIKLGVPLEDIPTEMIGIRPSDGAGIKDPVVSAHVMWGRMTPEQQAAFLADVKSQK